MKNNILAVPAAEKGRGGGHLTRCITLVNDLRSLGREACLFLPSQNEHAVKLLNSMNFNPQWIINNPSLIPDSSLLILDRFQTPQEELLRWKKIAPVIGIDEGGKCRDQFDFLIDILIPEKLGKPRANTASPSLMKLPQEAVRKNTCGKNDTLKILISFGQEDSAGLGEKTARKLSVMKKKRNMDITLLKGVLTKDFQSGLDVRVIEAIPNLAKRLNEYDLVITHYGITAYEALYAGAGVLLAHPTVYHKKLAKAAGFLDIKHLNSALKQNGSYKSPRAAFSKNNNTLLADLINGFSPQVNRICPVCAAETNTRSVARFRERTYRRCPNCGIICMDRTSPPPVEYAKEYFFEQYKNQYGKTYLEDFDNIKAASKRRLKIIKSLLCSSSAAHEKSPALLDIGCAYGPFLEAAKEEGFSPLGIDPAKDAVRYVQEKLDIPAIHGFFPTPHPAVCRPYSVITMWYVIEHFTDCVKVLVEIRRLLNPGGILAFSTPSFSGISGRANLNNFLSVSPADHFTVWSPKTAKKALALAGFKVQKTASAGHHPERFPLLGKFAKNKKSSVYRVLSAISKLFGLGDTFEVYAVRNF